MRTMSLVRLVYIDAPYEPLPMDLFGFNNGAYGREFLVIQVLSRQFEMQTYQKPKWRQERLI